MKKTLKTLAIATVSMISTGAIAATTNMENPLFAPKSGEFFSKTGAGLMYKRADHTDAVKLKHHDGADEFPVWRATEDFGYGIKATDRVYADDNLLGGRVITLKNDHSLQYDDYYHSYKEVK